MLSPEQLDRIRLDVLGGPLPAQHKQDAMARNTWATRWHLRLTHRDRRCQYTFPILLGNEVETAPPLPVVLEYLRDLCKEVEGVHNIEEYASKMGFADDKPIDPMPYYKTALRIRNNTFRLLGHTLYQTLLQADTE